LSEGFAWEFYPRCWNYCLRCSGFLLRDC
jgi:hypothetical protein